MDLVIRAALRLRRAAHLGRERLAALSGSAAYTCSVCDRPVHAFLPLPAFYARELSRHGYPYRIDDAETLNHRHFTCPRCGASDRDRLSALFVRERFPAGAPGGGCRVLHLAPSTALSALLRKIPSVLERTADLTMPGVDDLVDLVHLPYPDQSFGGFFCSHVLEHVVDDGAALRELHRVLRPGGFGVVLVPLVHGVATTDETADDVPPAERWRRFGQDDHVRLYAKADFLARLASAGFRVHELGQAHFGAASFEKAALTPSSVLYVVERNHLPTDPS